jgi:long-chain acyl-CoA synthetase
MKAMENKILTIKDILEHSVNKFGERNAFSFIDEEAITYEKTGNTVKSLQLLLEKLDISKGDRVAIYAQNMPNWSISYFAIAAMGAVVVPILPDFSVEEVGNILNHSEASAIFVSENLASKTAEINLKIPVIGIEDFNLISGAGTNIEYNEKEFSSLTYKVDPEDLAAIIYTSGTTGKSKGVMLLNRNIASNVHQSKGMQDINEYDRFISLLPLSHTFENTVGMLVPFMSGASITYLKKPPTAPVLLPALEKIKPTVLVSVPLIIEKVYFSKIKPTLTANKLMSTLYAFPPVRKVLHSLAGKKLYNTFGGQLKFFGIGGAKLNRKVELFLKEGGFPYAIGYGLTETSPVLAGMVPRNKYKLQSTGTAVEDVQLKINNPDPKTGEGEVWAKGPNIMKGYYKEPGLTSEVLTEDGWFRTGDLGVFDRNNYLSIKGRLKNVIIGASGENIYPEEIESVINNFKHVIESLVIHHKGKLVALVHINREELEEKYRDFKEEMTKKVEESIEEILAELHHQVNTRISKFSRLHKVVLQPVPFQKTATMKIKRYLYHQVEI